jgi:UDP-glucose 4-epimerase/UDP-arabinose 4-epimerase
MTRVVLITGGAGYVGAHAAKRLAAAGYLPVVYDNLSTGHASFVRWGPLVRGDIRDTAAVADALRSHRAVAVMHFAADAYVRQSIVDPAGYYDNNVVGVLSLLAGMRAAGCAHLIFSSTCAVYGAPSAMPIAEATPADPVNPYGASKLMAERILSDFQAAYGIRAIRLRYFNACGADQAGQLGEQRDPETHLIPRAMMALQGHIGDFQVFGTDYDTPDGTAVRDYVHVADLADAHCAALDRLLHDGLTGVFNLGTGAGVSVRKVLDAVQSVAGRTLPAIAGSRQPGDPACLVADPTLARRVLGFAAARSDLQTIVQTAWAWHQKAHPRLETTGAAKSRRAGKRGGATHATPAAEPRSGPEAAQGQAAAAGAD